MKLLMHACCAPCSVYCIDKLKEENIKPTIFWYNPNIHPFKEYEARRDCLKEYTKSIGLECIIEDEYGLDEFCRNVSNNLESRCVDYCYPVRLKKTFEFAKENGYDAVTTTLLYSIYQKHEYIKFLCEKYSKEYEIDFLYRDFRYGFWEGHDKAKELGLKNTNFKNPHGLDAADHYSSARDMSLIAKELAKHEKVFEFTSVYEDYLYIQIILD